ncbi:MAG: YggS family pyridoxal phosphate-dependent enzyme [Oscillospiraceae bacterium]|nr:YggS family pyridoxal phosphate-dependent enzyme [Oscillospiraceae bacterium]
MDTTQLEQISDNVKRVREAIETASRAADPARAEGTVTLVAASKTKPAEMIKAAIAAGVDAIGENRVQEMQEKAPLSAYEGAPLHFIGRVQTNKINKIVGACDLIESAGSRETIERIAQRAKTLGITQSILVEINIGREAQKSGILPEQTSEILDIASRAGGIEVLGLMAIPPANDIFERSCNFFDEMHNLFIDMSGKKYDNVSMRFLSMGMSDSYVEAIKAGASMVRIGSAIFGHRG